MAVRSAVKSVYGMFHLQKRLHKTCLCMRGIVLLELAVGKCRRPETMKQREHAFLNEVKSFIFLKNT